MENNRAIYEAAISLVANGFAVFPVQTRGKVPLGGNGCKDATKDKSLIENWWTAYPQANIGLATGAISGVFVLDIDPRHGGENTLGELVKCHGGLPRTVTAKTGGGGFHLYFHHVPGLRNSAGRVGAGVDIRTDGGYVVAPPSIHENGKSYEWAQGLGLEDTPIAEAPAWLLEIIRTKAQPARTAKDWENIITSNIPEGGRNDAIARLSGYLLGKRVPPYMTYDLVRCWNAVRCSPPLEEDEVFRTVNSIAQREFEKRSGRL